MVLTFGFVQGRRRFPENHWWFWIYFGWFWLTLNMHHLNKFTATFCDWVKIIQSRDGVWALKKHGTKHVLRRRTVFYSFLEFFHTPTHRCIIFFPKWVLSSKGEPSELSHFLNSHRIEGPKVDKNVGGGLLKTFHLRNSLEIIQKS